MAAGWHVTRGAIAAVADHTWERATQEAERALRDALALREVSN